MAQVTIYMDDETAARMRAEAKAAGLTVSAWLAGLVRERTRIRWPAEVEELAGAWADFPQVEELRGTWAADLPREPL